MHSLARVTLVRWLRIMSSEGHFILNVYARENAFLVRIYNAFNFILKLMALLDKLNFDNEGECAAFLPLWLADDVAAEFPDQFTADVKPESYPACIDFLSFLQESIHLEELRHVFLSDADTGIRYTDLQEIIRTIEMTQCLW